MAFGGFKADFDPNFGPTTGAIWISSLRRPSNRTWRAAGLDLGNGPGKLTAVAYCGHVPKTTERSASTVVQGAEQRHVTAKCSRGSHIAFGGFKAAMLGHGPFVQIDRLERASSMGWRAAAVNNSTSSTAGALTSFAYCK